MIITEKILVAVILCQILVSSKADAVMQCRLEELEKLDEKMMKHSNMREHKYWLEEQMKVTNHRINGLGKEERCEDG